MSGITKTEKQIQAIKLIADNKVILLEGGSRCFAPDQGIVTDNGVKRIANVCKGDRVLSQADNGAREYQPVLEVHHTNTPKRGYRIKLRNGKEICGTEDHLIWYEGGWHTLRHVVELVHGSVESHSRI